MRTGRNIASGHNFAAVRDGLVCLAREAVADGRLPTLDHLWLLDADEVFYTTVQSFKGLERPVVVLAVNGFNFDAVEREILHVGMSRARSLLVQTEMSVVEIALACGFENPGHFSRVYRTAFGISPTNQRRRLS